MGIVSDCLHFQSQMIVNIVKVSSFLHSKSQLITKCYLNMKGIDLFVKSRFWFLSRFWVKAEGRKNFNP